MGRVSAGRAQAHAAAQRERILDAAYECFVEHGFHQAGMARISEKAGMSPGLIYRYFENKSAIIKAICEQQLQMIRSDFQPDGTLDVVGEIVNGLGQATFAGRRRMSEALILELSAEATRDPELAALVSDFDAEIRANLRSWVKAKHTEQTGGMLSEEEAELRALMLQVMIEGVITRGAREPTIDRVRLRRAAEQIASLAIKGA